MDAEKKVVTLDQKRAAFAWVKVQGCSREYMILAKGAGALIMNNGLMAAFAYYQDKNKEHHQNLMRHLIEWLNHQYALGKQFDEIMTALHSGSSEQYRMATQETLDLLRWIRQFAAAVDKRN